MIIGYASRTGSSRNLAVIRRLGWRLLVVAGAVLRHEGFLHALDNGAWSCHVQGLPWDEKAFRDAVSLFGDSADWVVLPDIVCGGKASLDKSMAWVHELRGGCPMLIAVQDGMTDADIEPLLREGIAGVFVGGSTEWKELSLPMWGALKRRTGCYLHVGRVNSRRRIRLCGMAGADSFDGTSLTIYGEKTGDKLDAERQQTCLVLV